MVRISGVAAILLLAAGCSGPNADAPPAVDGPVPVEHAAGATAFQTYCAECHGAAGVGTDQGPPLVHLIYEPGHHGDQSFYSAARMGVPAHHWGFGNMPPVESVTDDELVSIVAYVRYLQREAGIQ